MAGRYSGGAKNAKWTPLCTAPRDGAHGWNRRRTVLDRAMAFLQSSPPRQPVFRAPPVVIWLIAALAGLHALRVLQSPFRAEAIVGEYALIPARYSHAFLAATHIDPGAWWERALPFVTYMGLHNDLMHLGINCVWLLAFGPIVARRFGSVLFLVFFLVCGVAGGALHVALNWGQPVPVIGASGAISGLMAAALRMLPTQIPWAMPGRDAAGACLLPPGAHFQRGMGGGESGGRNHPLRHGRRNRAHRLAGASGWISGRAVIGGRVRFPASPPPRAFARRGLNRRLPRPVATCGISDTCLTIIVCGQTIPGNSLPGTGASSYFALTIYMVSRRTTDGTTTGEPTCPKQHTQAVSFGLMRH